MKRDIVDTATDLFLENKRLRRERDEARARADEWIKSAANLSDDVDRVALAAARAKSERDEARAEAKRLERVWAGLRDDLVRERDEARARQRITLTLREAQAIVAAFANDGGDDDYPVIAVVSRETDAHSGPVSALGRIPRGGFSVPE